MPDTPWLSDEEQCHWRSFLRMQRQLFAHVEEHRQREFGLSAADYEVLVNLSEAPGGRMSSGDLREATQWEKSRLSHHLARMKERGLVRREPSDVNRYPDVTLTPRGRGAIEEAAPEHAANIRAWFTDVLGPQKLARFGEACDAVLAALEQHQQEECPYHSAD